MLYESDFYNIDANGNVIYIDWDNNVNNKFEENVKFIKECENIIPSFFTGVQDNTNRDVYEGDVYEDIDFPEKQDTIEFYKGGFFLGDEHLIDINFKLSTYIGNIYEKPELIKVNEK